MTQREQLVALVKTLPEPELKPATRFLEYLRDQHSDPVALALEQAPFDDEPVTEEEGKALEEALLDRDQGRVYSHQEIRNNLLEEGYASIRIPFRWRSVVMR
ncbi:MAG: hypothetical protein V3T72_05325 [Thermoanaerobaculia bacterium]